MRHLGAVTAATALAASLVFSGPTAARMGGGGFGGGGFHGGMGGGGWHGGMGGGGWHGGIGFDYSPGLDLARNLRCTGGFQRPCS
jgi:hypothetical protein